MESRNEIILQAKNAVFKVRLIVTFSRGIKSRLDRTSHDIEQYDKDVTGTTS